MQSLRIITSILPILVIIISCSSLTAQESDHPLPFISVEGNSFIDENGDTFNFRGVSSSDPDRLEKAGQWNKR